MWSSSSDVRVRRRAAARLLLLAAACGLLAACGFQPLYAETDEAGVTPSADLAAIYVVPLTDRGGQIFHNLLRDRLNPRGQPSNPAYRLEVDVSESVQEVAIRSDETATRANLRLTANFRLSRSDSGETLLAGDSKAITSYNILTSQFATYTSEEDARKRGLRELSDNIRKQLGTFFSRARAAQSS